MDVRKCLARAGRIEEELEANVAELARWQGRVDRLTNALEGLPDKLQSDCMEDAVTQLELTKLRIERQALELRKERVRLEDLLELLPDSTYQRLFHYRYVEKMTFEQIAEVMFYSLRWIMKLHKRGLGYLEKKLTERGEDLGA